MATTSQTCVMKNRLYQGVDVLKRCGFPETKWCELGLKLGLRETTLDMIKRAHPHNVSFCMTECLFQWLCRVHSTGGANLDHGYYPCFDLLSDALRSMNETAVAEKLKHQVLNEIFNNCYAVLSQSLCDSFSVAQLLYAERMLTEEAVDRVVSASPSIPHQREALLAAVKEAVETDPNSLHTFTNALCTISTNESLGQAILDDISKYFPNLDLEVVPKTIDLPQDTSTDTEVPSSCYSSSQQLSPEVEVHVPVSKDLLKNFISIRKSYGRMFSNVDKILKQKFPSIKECLSSFSTVLSKKVEQCTDISSILCLICEKCSLNNIEVLHSVVEELKITKAASHIETYRAELKEFYESLSIGLYLEKTFASIPETATCTCTFLIDWKPEEHLLKDIKEVFSELVGKLHVRCMYVECSESESVNIAKHEMEGTSTRVSVDTLNEWLEEGSVDLTITRVNMLGAPGSGKTCAQLLLLDEDPPTEDVADGTSISNPIKVAVDDESMKWDQITRDKLLGGLAADLIKASKKQSGAEALSVDTHPLSLSKGSVSSKSRKDEVDYHVEEIVQEILATKPVGIQLKGHWLYVIDLCGQPAYQELLPLFNRAASLNIITLDLSKPFEEKFDMMYRIDGRYFPCCSKSTQLESFQSTVSLSANFNSLDIPSVTKEHGHSMHLVLGTHYDKVDETALNKCEVALKTSMSLLQPYLRDRIICNNKESEESIIFPVNTMAASEERAKHSEEIRRVIWLYGSGASLNIKIPIRWFAFELSFPEKKRIISFKEALSIGKRYGMKEEEIKQALQYFHDVSLMLYYPEVTDVVFVDPKPILNILSQLLALTYVTDSRALKSILLQPLYQIVINHLKDGFFNEEIFTHLKCKVEIFSQPEFQLCDLISLLLHLNIITKVEDNKKGSYFIPYALSSYQGSAIPTVEVSNVQPLLIVWKDYESSESPPPSLPVPQGLFPLALTHLLNQKEFKTKLPSSRSNHHYFRFRDAMSIKITFNHIPQTLHLINRYTHIEVSFNGPKEHCPIIRNLIMKAIGKVTNDLHLDHNYIDAFACIKDQEKKCYCIVVNEEQFIVNCTECPESYPITEDKCKCWFECVTTEINDPLNTTSNHRITIKDLNEVLTDLKSGGFSDESYFGLGLELGLHHPTLNTIKSDNATSVDHLRECISKWLMRLDDVDKHGGANWTTLCNAVEKMNRAAADSIRAKHDIMTSQSIEQSCPQNHVEPDTQTTGFDKGARKRYPQKSSYTIFTPSGTEGNDSSSSPNPSYTVKWFQYEKIFILVVGLLALGLTAILILFWFL